MKIEKIKYIKTVLIIIGIICIIIGFGYINRANDVKENYYLSENYPNLNKHVYVGGDAYNYIINSNYFTGYNVLASSLFICGTILISTSILLKNKDK